MDVQYKEVLGVCAPYAVKTPVQYNNNRNRNRNRTNPIHVAGSAYKEPAYDGLRSTT